MIVMIAARTAEGIAILAGIGGFLSCLALHIVGRMISSPRRSTTTLITGIRPPQQAAAPALPEAIRPPIQPATPSQAYIEAIPTIQPVLDWRERGDRLVGSYRAANGTYAGHIKNHLSAKREFYIVNPPQALRNHAHSRAFTHQGQGCYLIEFAVSPVNAAAGVRAIERMLADAEGVGQRLIRPVVRPAQRARVAIHPVDRPYWRYKHWKVRGNQLDGFYRTPLGSFEGHIKQFRSHRPEFFIVNPPRQLKSHAHWACFHSRGPNRYWIHFGSAPASPDAGILEVERVLAEALAT